MPHDKTFDERLEEISKVMVERGEDLEAVGKISRKQLMIYGAIVSEKVLHAYTQQLKDNIQEHIEGVKEYVYSEFANDIKRVDRCLEQNAEIIHNIQVIQDRQRRIEGDLEIMFQNLKVMRNKLGGEPDKSQTDSTSVPPSGPAESNQE